jgi:hypothetical protein
MKKRRWKRPAEAAVKKPKKEHKERWCATASPCRKASIRKSPKLKDLPEGRAAREEKRSVARRQALVEMNAAQLKRALAGLERIKTGRPKKP